LPAFAGEHTPYPPRILSTFKLVRLGGPGPRRIAFRVTSLTTDSIFGGNNEEHQPFCSDRWVARTTARESVMAEVRKKIAVLIAHGMGEQIPMETLTAFVQAAWVTNTDAQWVSPPDEKPEEIWFKPDPLDQVACGHGGQGTARRLL
jgi:hypothetical protein